nr:uncharacterized mitochondrial protein AtMg00810-like [Tanacetum cinerariifolium]
MARAVRDQGGLSQMFNEDFHTCMFACFLLQEEPKRVHQALKDPSWIEAMQEELLYFKIQNVWILVDLPYEKRAIGNKWVYRNKNDERGIVIRNKARLVAQGHTQEEVINYEEVFAPEILLVQIHVDDIIFGATNKALCQSFEKLMKDKFQISSMAELTFFLGLQVKQKKDGIFISQDKYVAKILRKFGLSKGKSASTPIDAEKPLLKDLDVKRIFRYLKGKPYLGLWYPKDSPFDLVAYSDSDYAGASLDRKSTTEGCQFLGCRLISWQCKKQTVVATSSTEAKYIATANGCAQVLWIQNQLLDYGVRKGFSGVKTPLFEGMLDDRQPADEGLVDEQVQVDDAVEENVAEDVAHDAIPSPQSHDIPSLSQEPSSPPQQPQSSPQAPPQGVEFPTQIQQVLNVCSALTKRVENLENDNAAQKLVIIKMKARVKRLEKANLVQSSKLRRLRKVVTTAKLITDVVTATASQVSAASATISATKPSIPAAAPTVSWLVQKQTALGKDSSNPLIVDSLLKTIWFSIHHHLTIEVLAILGKTATEDVIREILQLDDAEDMVCLPNEEILAGLAQMGYEKPSTKLTFYKAFFSSQ